MSYNTILPPGEPIIVQTLNDDFDVAGELGPAMREVHDVLSAYEKPVFLIVDMSAYKLSVDDLVVGASMSSGGEEPIFKHPNIRQVVFVSPSKIVELAAKGMNTATFGHVDIRVFASQEAALAYVRA